MTAAVLVWRSARGVWVARDPVSGISAEANSRPEVDAEIRRLLTARERLVRSGKHGDLVGVGA